MKNLAENTGGDRSGRPGHRTGDHGMDQKTDERAKSGQWRPESESEYRRSERRPGIGDAELKTDESAKSRQIERIDDRS